MGLIQSITASIGERTVEFALAGAGGLPLVLINGTGGHLDSWFRLFDKLAGSGAVLAYNRPSIGRSSASHEPQTVHVCTRDLVALIEHVGIEGPLLVVGHSFGGLIANYFARTRPDRICGVVMLDATAVDDIAVSNDLGSAPRFVDRLGMLFTPKLQHSEILNAQDSVTELARAGPFPPIALAVVSGGKSAKGLLVPKAFREARSRNQIALAGESPRGEHTIAARSGHFPQLTEPGLCLRVIADMRGQMCEAQAA